MNKFHFYGITGYNKQGKSKTIFLIPKLILHSVLTAPLLFNRILETIFITSAHMDCCFPALFLT